MIKEAVNIKLYVFKNKIGYINANRMIYITKIILICLKNFSEEYNIFSISCLFLFAIGLYNVDFITGPIPDSNNVMYERNWVIEETIPLTVEPNEDNIIFGTTNP